VSGKPAFSLEGDRCRWHEAVLDRAAQPMPTELGTPVAIHLASALLWRDATGIEPIMATHDAALGLAAQAHGLEVPGT
jgi:hypothetical protein